MLAYGATVGTDADDVKLAVMVYPNEQETRGMTSYEILNILQEAIDQINNGYPSYQQIQMINLRESEFPKTSSQKIKRQMI